MKTAVEKLISEIKGYPSDCEIFQEALEAEKQQHYKTWLDSTCQFDNSVEMTYKKSFEDYYRETYGSKGSETTSSQTTSDKWKEYQDWLNEIPEISDEEIEKGAKEWYNKEGAYSASAIALKTWVYAIKWYREFIKQKS